MFGLVLTGNGKKRNRRQMAIVLGILLLVMMFSLVGCSGGGSSSGGNGGGGTPGTPVGELLHRTSHGNRAVLAATAGELLLAACGVSLTVQ